MTSMDGFMNKAVGYFLNRRKTIEMSHETNNSDLICI